MQDHKIVKDLNGFTINNPFGYYFYFPLHTNFLNDLCVDKLLINIFITYCDKQIAQSILPMFIETINEHKFSNKCAFFRRNIHSLHICEEINNYPGRCFPLHIKKH